MRREEEKIVLYFVPLMDFSLHFEQGALHFYLALDLANFVASWSWHRLQLHYFCSTPILDLFPKCSTAHRTLENRT